MNLVSELVRELGKVSQDTPDNIRDLCAALRSATGNPLIHLWRVATADPSDPPNESEENVCNFYRRFPMLPGLRPLMSCPVCLPDEFSEIRRTEILTTVPNGLEHMCMMNLTGAFSVLYRDHDWTGGQLADWVEVVWRRQLSTTKDTTHAPERKSWWKGPFRA